MLIDFFIQNDRDILNFRISLSADHTLQYIFSISRLNYFALTTSGELPVLNSVRNRYFFGNKSKDTTVVLISMSFWAVWKRVNFQINFKNGFNILKVVTSGGLPVFIVNVWLRLLSVSAKANTITWIDMLSTTKSQYLN